LYHGVRSDLYHLHEQPRGYLAFLGRISPEKGVERAIEIARRSGMKLRIAAKIDRAVAGVLIAAFANMPRQNHVLSAHSALDHCAIP
jgi:glycosyltransferase involved in cell wall biosynthesis